MSQEDEMAMAVMEGETKWTGKRYEVPMLWDSSTITLPNNYPLVRKRFSFLERRLRGKPELHDKMNKIIIGYMETDPPQARKMSA